MVSVADCLLCKVVRYCAGSNGTKVSIIILKSTEIKSGHSELSVISQVSAVEGCPLSGVPL